MARDDFDLLRFLMARTKEQHSAKHYTLSRDSCDNGVLFTLSNEVVCASVASFCIHVMVA